MQERQGMKAGGSGSDGLGPVMKPGCPACARIEKIRTGTDPHFVCEMRESLLVVHKHQRYEGWCTLWLKDHHEHLGLLERARQVRLSEDVIDVAGAMHRSLGGGFGDVRINYENLGNVVSHVHWHLIPRRASDPNPKATVWVRPEAETDCGVSDLKLAELVAVMGRAVRG